MNTPCPTIDRREIAPGDKVFNLQPAQDGFIFSEARYPAFIGAWGTGKSFSLIQRGMLLSEESPNNLGVIFRREFTDLRDSTCKDFELYTGLKISSERSVVLPNKSEILFRHLEEMSGTVQNLNLGWFAIEQGDELPTGDIFNVLRGRLRREARRRSGFVVGNTNGHDWQYKLWKISQDKDYELHEATSFDAEKYLPTDTIADWRKLEQSSPKIYRRFVLNSWDDADTIDVIINPEVVDRATKREVNLTEGPGIFRVVSVDVARYGDDKTVFYALESDGKRIRVMGKEVHEKRSTMETVGLAQVFGKKNGDIQSFAVDEIGVGAGVVDRLRELERHVIPVNSAEREHVRPGCYNRRAEIYVSAAETFEAGNIQLLPQDLEANEELSWTRYKTIKSTGIYQVEAKEDVKKRFGRSPDSADALLYGMWALPRAKVKARPDKYLRHRTERAMSPMAL